MGEGQSSKRKSVKAQQKPGTRIAAMRGTFWTTMKLTMTLDPRSPSSKHIVVDVLFDSQVAQKRSDSKSARMNGPNHILFEKRTHLQLGTRNDWTSVKKKQGRGNCGNCAPCAIRSHGTTNEPGILLRHHVSDSLVVLGILA